MDLSGCYHITAIGLARLARAAPLLTALDISGCDSQVCVCVCDRCVDLVVQCEKAR